MFMQNMHYNTEGNHYYNYCMMLCSVVMPQYIVCLSNVHLSVHPSVRPSVMFMFHDHICWNSSKIIPRPNSLRPVHGLIPMWAI